MSLEDKKIMAFSKPVSAMPDVPGAAGYTAAQVKEWFDSNSSVEIKNSVNGIIDFLLGFTDGEGIKGIRLNEDNVIEVTTDGANYIDTGYSKEYITNMLADKANKSDVLLKTNTEEFTPTDTYQPATKKYVDDKVLLAGAGDMTQAVYDPTGRQTDIFAYAKQLVENIEFPVSGINPNLLDNWYFDNPVNQRGQTEYSGPAYSVDRWFIPSANAGLRLDEFSFYSSASGNIIFQYIDNQDEFTGKIVTLSALTNNALISTTIEIPDVLPTGTSTIGKGSNPIDGVSIYLRTLNSKLTFVFYAASNYIPNTVIKVKAAKLELGNTQTLAHQDANGNWVLNEIPNYAEQLAICKQYDPNNGTYIGLNYLPLTGGALTGSLSVGGYLSFPRGSGANASNVSIYKNANDSADYGVLIEDYNKNNQKFSLRLCANEQNAYLVANGVVPYKIFGEHNKPSGSYTGNNSSGERIVSVGGAGDVLLIRRYATCYFISAAGYHPENGSSSTATFVDGVLTIKSNDDILNNSGVTYYYTVL